MAVFTVTETGVTTNAEDLILKLKTFAENNGYTTNLYSDNTISSVIRGKRLHLQKNGKFYNFVGVSNKSPISASAGTDLSYSNNNLQGIYSTLSTAFSGSVDWFANTGSSTDTIRAARVSTNSNYRFYLNDKTLVIVIKYSTVNYSFMIFGESLPYASADSHVVNTASGYEQIKGSGVTDLINERLFRSVRSSSSTNTTSILNGTNLNLTSANILNDNINPNSTSNLYPAFNLPNNTTTSNDYFINRANNRFTGTSILFPIHFYRLVSTYYQPVGYMKDLYHVDFTYFTPEQTLTIGSNVFIVFPYNQKRNPVDYSLDGNNMGLAIQIAE